MRRLGLAFGAVVLLGFVAGCSQSGAGSPSGTPVSLEPSAPASVSPTPRPPEPTLLNPAPPEMLGKWSAVFGEDDIGTIRISPTGMRITRFATAAIRLEVFGDELVLSHSQLCEGEGRYRWTIEGDKLTFESVTPDACDGRAKSFDGVTYTRVSD
jgi:hypothetical protein